MYKRQVYDSVTMEVTGISLTPVQTMGQKLAKAGQHLSLIHISETSLALGFGFRCGFLGLLHLEIIQERLESEFDLDLVTTAPSVIYKIHKTSGEVIDLTNPSNCLLYTSRCV